MLKTTLSLLFLSVILISCCDCDCPDAPIADVAEVASVEELPVEATTPDTVMTETPVQETTTEEEQVVNEVSDKQEKIIETPPDKEDEKPTPVDMNNIFGDGGSGTGSGSGDGLGSDNGTGASFGSGTGNPDDMEDSPNRRQISSVDLSGIQTASDVTILLQIAIDGAGNVTKASVIKSKTTTTDQALIDQVIKAVKSQLKYSRNTGAALKYEMYTVKLKVN